MRVSATTAVREQNGILENVKEYIVQQNINQRFILLGIFTQPHQYEEINEGEGGGGGGIIDRYLHYIKRAKEIEYVFRVGVPGGRHGPRTGSLSMECRG